MQERMSENIENYDIFQILGRTNVFADTSNLSHFRNFDKVCDEFRRTQNSQNMRVFSTHRIVTPKCNPFLILQMAMFYKKITKNTVSRLQ